MSQFIIRSIECFLILIVFILTGCASTEPYHVKDPVTGNCADPSAEICKQSYYQEYTDFDLAFVEFTERGNVFNSQWVETVLQKIRDHEKKQGVVVVTFVHGWKHNARETDPNLLDFKESLAWIANESGSLYDRRLIGLYIGWRGASLDLPIVQNLTFWDRKAVAEEVGKGGVTKLLLELNKIDGPETKNSLVIIGHSFGGAIVVSALTEILTDRIINQSTNSILRNPIGDGVIVLNPAIEANQALSLVEAGMSGDDLGDSLYFISISSDADDANHYMFPLGQTIGLFFTWHQHDLQRPYYIDRLSKETLLLKEEHLDSTTVGNFAPYLTHRLVMESKDDENNPKLLSCDQVPDRCVPKGLTTLSGHPTFEPLSEKSPLHFIKTDKTFIGSHNDIFNQKVMTFILANIDDIVRRSAPVDKRRLDIEKDGTSPASILTMPQKFEKRFQEIYPTLQQEKR